MPTTRSETEEPSRDPVQLDPGPGDLSSAGNLSAPDQTPAPLAPALTVAAVARRLGVAPATLRTWDRRYGLGPSQHMAGSHRRYSATDVARLLVMRRLTLEGVAPSEAARSALSSAAASRATSVRIPSVSEVVDAYSDAVPMAADPTALLAAAGHFDNAAVRWMLARVQPRDVVAWWTDLVEPALGTLSQRPVLERPGESVAPALESAAFAELRSRGAVAAARAQSGANHEPRRDEVDLAGPVDGPLEGRPRPSADGKHGSGVLTIGTGVGSDLLVHVVATALQGKGVQARVLAAATPASVAAAVARMRPGVSLVHAGGSAEDAARAARLVRALVGADPTLPVFVHREGAAPFESSTTVHHVRTLTGALHEILAVLA